MWSRMRKVSNPMIIFAALKWSNASSLSIFAVLGRQVLLKSVGCFTDYTGGVRDVRVKDFGVRKLGIATMSYDPSVGAYFISQLTPQLCASFCSLGGFEYIALQSHYWCACGNSYGSQGMANGADCNGYCGGNNNQTCGGESRNSIYRLTYMSEGSCKSKFVPGNRTWARVEVANNIAFRTLSVSSVTQCVVSCSAGCEAAIFVPTVGLCHLLEFAAVPTALNSSAGDFYVRL